MVEQKTSKRKYITVVQSDKGNNPTRGSEGDIYTIHQYFSLRFKHLKGSNRPVGYFHDGFSSRDGSVTVRWLYTDSNGFFAPELTFRPTDNGIKVANKVAKALRGFGWNEDSPLALILKLNATPVRFMDDNKEGCWDDYRPADLPTQDEKLNAMEILALAAR